MHMIFIHILHAGRGGGGSVIYLQRTPIEDWSLQGSLVWSIHLLQNIRAADNDNPTHELHSPGKVLCKLGAVCLRG